MLSAVPEILLIDDNPIVRRALGRRLQAVSTRIIDLGATEALALLQRRHFDLILVEYDLADSNGVGLCQRLKADPATRSIPLILLNSSGSGTMLHLAFNHGAAAVLDRSEIDSQLLATVRSVLQRIQFARHHTILVVDDSLMVRTLVGSSLREAGFRVVEAGDGQQALQRLAKGQPDLIISDLDMPVMDGFNFCREVKADSRFAAIPFVVMSSLRDRAAMRRVIQQGAIAYLAKPFKMEQMVILVEKILTDHVRLLDKDRERLETERRLMLATITGLIEALEARDGYTRGHSEAVASLLVSLGRHMGAQAEELELLEIGGKLHDLGKIGVRDHVLLKPGRLDNDEFAMIQEHPAIGVQILGGIPSLIGIEPIVRHHHERFDGRGYPDGIGGREIHIWARLTAVADVYHALTSRRPYRDQQSEAQAISLIVSERGKQLCPDCVDLFLDLRQSQSFDLEISA